jgi:hypothetical protein
MALDERTACGLMRGAGRAARLRPCIGCGTPTPGKSRCERCGGDPGPRTSADRKQRATLVKSSALCWICGHPPTPTDPLEADHLQPRSLGGPDNPQQLPTRPSLMQPQTRRPKGRRPRKLRGGARKLLPTPSILRDGGVPTRIEGRGSMILPIPWKRPPTPAIRGYLPSILQQSRD